MRRCALLLVAVALLGAAGASHAQLLGLGWRGREMGSCTAQAPPMPAGLKASVLAEGSVSLSWAAGDAAAPPPTGPACISGYSILVMASGQTAKDGKKFTTKATSATINNLVPSQRYTVEVRAISSRGFPDSPAATLTALRPTRAAGAAFAAGGSSPAASALEGWQCVAREGYNVCSAGRAGLCEPVSCAEMARLGRCSAPYLRVQDWAARTITQHCATECGGCAAAGAAKLGPADYLAPVNEYCCAFKAGQYFNTQAEAGAFPDL